jgi:hypothetical protein
MSKVPKIPLDLSDDFLRKSMRLMITWALEDFDPFDVGNIAEWKNLYSITEQMSRRFFGDTQKITLRHHEASALLRLISIWPDARNEVQRQLNYNIQPLLDEFKPA